MGVTIGKNPLTVPIDGMDTSLERLTVDVNTRSTAEMQVGQILDEWRTTP